FPGPVRCRARQPRERIGSLLEHGDGPLQPFLAAVRLVPLLHEALLEPGDPGVGRGELRLRIAGAVRHGWSLRLARRLWRGVGARLADGGSGRARLEPPPGAQFVARGGDDAGRRLAASAAAAGGPSPTPGRAGPARQSAGGRGPAPGPTLPRAACRRRTADREWGCRVGARNPERRART